VIGLLVGAVGATLFLDSMPGHAGSPEERATKLEMSLKQAQNRIAALEANSSQERDGTASAWSRTRSDERKRALADGARSIADDLRAGRPVNPEDIFRASKPLLRDLAPLFDRMRVKEQQQVIDRMTGEFARKYGLTPESKSALREWFEGKSNEQARRWNELVTRDSTTLEDVVRASQDVRLDEGLETFMQSFLPSDKLAAFKAERLAERAHRVEQQADAKVQQLDSIVGLDERQRDQVFGIMARNSRDYDPSMILEGARGEIGATPGGKPQDAMLAVLRPDQRATYEAERQRRREAAAKEAEAVGLTLPAGWEMLESNDFR
jgi:hypothetical protein